jgi:hypothetical protein
MATTFFRLPENFRLPEIVLVVWSKVVFNLTTGKKILPAQIVLAMLEKFSHQWKKGAYNMSLETSHQALHLAIEGNWKFNCQYI